MSTIREHFFALSIAFCAILGTITLEHYENQPMQNIPSVELAHNETVAPHILVLKSRNSGQIIWQDASNIKFSNNLFVGATPAMVHFTKSRKR